MEGVQFEIDCQLLNEIVSPETMVIGTCISSSLKHIYFFWHMSQLDLFIDTKMLFCFKVSPQKTPLQKLFIL